MQVAEESHSLRQARHRVSRVERNKRLQNLCTESEFPSFSALLWLFWLAANIMSSLVSYNRQSLAAIRAGVHKAIDQAPYFYALHKRPDLAESQASSLAVQSTTLMDPSTSDDDWQPKRYLAGKCLALTETVKSSPALSQRGDAGLLQGNRRFLSLLPHSVFSLCESSLYITLQRRCVLLRFSPLSPPLLVTADHITCHESNTAVRL